ncbi:MAG: hypothetical protein WAW10_13960 [Gallionella sp.]
MKIINSKMALPPNKPKPIKGDSFPKIGWQSGGVFGREMRLRMGNFSFGGKKFCCNESAKQFAR